MQYRICPVTPFQQNCSLIWCEHTGKGAFIDPGGDAERLLALAHRHAVTIEKVLLTHGHLDHVGAAQEIADTLSIPIIGPHWEDAFWLQSLPQQSQMFGFPSTPALSPSQWLEDGDFVEVGQLSLQVLRCPGHTPGHVVFFCREARLAFVGDVLFQGSIGRTDFPRGDYDTLINSILTRLLPLGDDVQFVPGHGPMSSFGEERRYNPFLNT